MKHQVRGGVHSTHRYKLLQKPLFRLLAINLVIGASLAALLVGGLLVLNPAGLRDLILADRSPGLALALLLGSFIITLGSTAMGTAVMALGRQQCDDGGSRGPPELVTQQLVGRRGNASVGAAL